MFTFIHAADLHLDSPLRGLSRHQDAPVEAIRSAARRALENLVDLALEKKVAFVLIAGDLYDGDQKDYNTALFLNQQMIRLQAGEIPVIAISGNHDAQSVITKALSPPENVTFLPTRKPGSISIPGLPVTIHGQGFAKASVPDNIVLNYPERRAKHFNIGLLHTSLAGSRDHDTYAPCSLADLQAKDYQYWALGHIHQPQVLCEEPWVVYSGNIQGRKINEAGARGCSLVEVGEDLEVISHQQIPLDVVRWFHPEIDLAGVTQTDELREKIAEAFNDALQQADGRLVALRLTLTGVTELHDTLHAQASRWQAECQSLASEVDDEQLWFERLKVKTSPAYDLAELAKRDELTGLVIHALTEFDFTEEPPEVAALLKKLPAEVVRELGDPSFAKEELSGMILHSIAHGSAD